MGRPNPERGEQLSEDLLEVLTVVDPGPIINPKGTK